jgi:hypothetical protein
MKSLFENDEELFCPLDGQKLTESKWEWCGNRLLTCPKGHVWEARWSNMWAHQLEFDVIDMVHCPDCRQLCPKRLMKNAVQEPPKKREKGKICPDCFEVIKKAWRPDLKQSYARLVITPIRRGDKVIFQHELAVKIEPYPNPYMAGGCWGWGTEESETEIEKLIADFTSGDSWFGRWHELGVKFEVIRKPEMTAAEAINERQCDYIEENPEEEADPEHAQMRLIA